MKILHVYNHFYPTIGGIERYIEDLCVELIKRGHKSDVCCLERDPVSGKKLPKKEIYKGITIHRIPCILDLKYYKIAPSILKIVKQYDIIHIHGIGFFSDFLSLTKKIHKKPIILSTHGGIFHTSKLYFLKKIYFLFWERLMLKNFGKIIAVSKNDEKLFSRISKKVIFIPDFIDYKKFSKIKRRPKKGLLIFIGRISSNKRIDRLIELVYSLKSEGKNYELYIAGPDFEGEQKKLEELVRLRGLEKNVKFLGKISEKEKLELLSKAEFFVSASEYEGFGISVIEAMAAGVPVIVNDIEAFRNIIKNGENGFIVDFSNFNDVIYLINIKKRKKLLKISKNEKKTIRKYDVNFILKKIEKIYKKFIFSL